MIEPRHNRVLVRRIPEPEGLIIVTDADKTLICEVLAVGPGRWEDGVFTKTAVKPGDKVLLPGWASQHPDSEFPDGSFLVQDMDIAGIITFDEQVPVTIYRKPVFLG